MPKRSRPEREERAEAAACRFARRCCMDTARGLVDDSWSSPSEYGILQPCPITTVQNVAATFLSRSSGCKTGENMTPDFEVEGV